MNGILFETGSGKWLELIPGNARFHSDREKASVISGEVWANNITRLALVDRHNIDWYVKTIEFHPINVETRSEDVRIACIVS